MLNRHEMDKAVRAIVRRQGGERERLVLRTTHDIEPDPETWNDHHKVVNVTSRTPEEDGYRPGFAVDLVTGLICG